MNKNPITAIGQREAVIASAFAVLVLSGCAIGPDYRKPQLPASATEQSWVAPLPHEGKVSSLLDWWGSWNDPVLVQLIERSQSENSSVTAAVARISQSRASYAQLTSALFPAFTANAGDIRSRAGSQILQGQRWESGGDTAGQAVDRNKSISIDASWELDVVGGARRGRNAGAARLRARETEWHDARISIASEVATEYVKLRSCEVLLKGYEQDTTSRLETARLTRLKEEAGFESPANVALADASVAEARARQVQQHSDCELSVKALAQLTNMVERELVVQLNKTRGVQPTPSGFSITAIPAEAISQRPDVAAAEYELISASNDIGLAIADRFPRISLTGSIGYSDISTGGFASRGSTWSWGPRVTLPVFDAGRRAAVVDEARANYALALSAFQGKTLTAVREVEESLVRLDGANRREKDTVSALNGYQASLRAANARVRAGSGSLPELEGARRAVVQAQSEAVGAVRDRLFAWISLYKAVGGGWREGQTGMVAAATYRPQSPALTPPPLTQAPR